MINILNRILPVFPNTREHANKIVDIVSKRVPDSEAGKCKTSLDFLAQSYRTSIGKMTKSSLPDISISGTPNSDRRPRWINQKRQKSQGWAEY